MKSDILVLSSRMKLGKLEVLLSIFKILRYAYPLLYTTESQELAELCSLNLLPGLLSIAGIYRCL